jgi:hemerythrin-like domain-containing protein
MCDHCGCRQIEPIGELMDEHTSLLDAASDITIALGRGEASHAADQVRRFATRLTSHVRREEDGIFTALRDSGEFLEEVTALEEEHRDFDTLLAELDPGGEEFAGQVTFLFATLAEHIERENVGVFPVSVVTLGADGWNTITRVHSEQPSFLTGS